MKKLLFIVDPQNSFMEGGELPVEGSREDMRRLTGFIGRENFNNIVVSLDTHNSDSVHNQKYWYDEDGNNPELFTQIKTKDVKEGKSKYKYVKGDSVIGKYSNTDIITIWPSHCGIGTKGHKVCDELRNILEEKYDRTRYIIKGMYESTEMYGALDDVVSSGIYQIEYETAQELKYDNYINSLDLIKSYDVVDMVLESDKIYIAGEAKSHCVYETVKNIRDILDKNNVSGVDIILLDNCSSTIPAENGDKSYAYFLFDRLNFGRNFFYYKNV